MQRWALLSLGCNARGAHRGPSAADAHRPGTCCADRGVSRLASTADATNQRRHPAPGMSGGHCRPGRPSLPNRSPARSEDGKPVSRSYSNFLPSRRRVAVQQFIEQSERPVRGKRSEFRKSLKSFCQWHGCASASGPGHPQQPRSTSQSSSAARSRGVLCRWHMANCSNALVVVRRA
jgi:hypothetical protein